MPLRVFCAFCAVLLASLSLASAHGFNESYVYFTVTEEALTGRVEARLPDLDTLVGLDADGDGKTTTEEFSARADDVIARFEGRVTLRADGTEHKAIFDGYDFLRTPEGTFAQMHFAVPGIGAPPEEVEVIYVSPFQETDPGHLGYGLIENNYRTGVEDNEGNIAVAFRPGSETQTLYLDGEPGWTVFGNYIQRGARHVWDGFDHMIFLIALLLPAVLRREDGQWSPVETIGPGLVSILTQITTFALASSATLALATLGVLQLPEVFVEIVIAFAIIAVAVLNLYPRLAGYALAVVLVYGLLHGFGFAEVLTPLGTRLPDQFIGLAGFGLGVEFGLLGVAILLLPILYSLRQLSLYPLVMVRLGSVGIILLAIVWFLQTNRGVIAQLQQQLTAVGS